METHRQTKRKKKRDRQDGERGTDRQYDEKDRHIGR